MRVRIMAKLQGENKPGLYSKSVSASNLVCIPKTERLRVRVLHLGSRIYLKKEGYFPASLFNINFPFSFCGFSSRDLL